MSYTIQEKENNSKHCNLNDQKMKYKRFDIEYSKIINNKKNNSFALKKQSKISENTDVVTSEMEILKKIREKNKKFLEKKQEIDLNHDTTPERKKERSENYSEIYLDIESKKISDDYAVEIFKTLKDKYEFQRKQDFLARHNISPKLRAKMVDWMIEVLCSYKCNDMSFFRSISLLDVYLGKCLKPKDSSELHLLGVASMFLIGKFEEIYPIKLKIVQEKIAHRKLTNTEIKDCETEIISALDFDLMGVTLYEFVTLFTQFTNLKSCLKKHMYLYYQKISCYLSKLIMHDYELVNKFDYVELAVTLMFVSFKVIQQIEPDFPLNEKIYDIRNLTGISEDSIIKTAKKVLAYAQNFEKANPSLNNLKKFHEFSFEDIFKRKI